MKKSQIQFVDDTESDEEYESNDNYEIGENEF